MTTQTAEAAANVAHVQCVLRLNQVAATMYRNLRAQYAEEIINIVKAYFHNDEEAREAASCASFQASTTAQALITGLMLDAYSGWDKYTASLAAIDYTRADFDPKALFYGLSAEPKRVYLTAEPADPYTISIAPHRVLATNGGMTLYLFSEADARIFTERTEQSLTPYHTL